MSKFKHDLILRIIKILNVILISIPWIFCWNQCYLRHIDHLPHEKSFILIIMLYIGLYIIFGRLYEVFAISVYKGAELVYGQFLAESISNGIVYILIWLLSKDTPKIIPIFVVQIIQLTESVLWTYLSQKIYFRIFKPMKMAVVYDRNYKNQELISEHGLERKYEVCFSIPVEKCLENLEILKNIEVVFMSGVHSHDRNIILKYCVMNGKEVLVIPRIGDVIMSGAYPMHVFHQPILKTGRYLGKPEYVITKRLFDIVVSIIMLIVLSPLMLVVAVAIKLTDQGPVFYKQVRLTKDEKNFEILKFRSMRVDAEKDGVARLSTGENDDRITPVGHFMRRFRIDELPQFINILKGDLSICGPRPERPEIAEEYCKEIPEFALRLQVKAGLTGYAQVYGKYNSTPYDKLQMDLMYIAHSSLFEDLKIMLMTIKILFVAESTEGIAEGSANALQIKTKEINS